MITQNPAGGNFSPDQEPGISSHAGAIHGGQTPVELILSLLQNVTKTGDGWKACCPAHEDSNPSLSIKEGADGRVLVHCHAAACTIDQICEKVGLKTADLFPKSPPVSTSTEPRRSQRKEGNRRPGEPKPDGEVFGSSGKAVAELERQKRRKADRSWTYLDADGEPVGIILRWDLPGGKKDIRPVSRHPDGWRIGGMPDPRPLYRLPELAGASQVYVTEGEKAADAARSLGLTATTSAHGSQSPGKTDWTPLTGKPVVILPDNDEPGRKYTATVAGILMNLDPPAVVKVVNLPDLPDKGDIFDWVERRGDAVEPEELRKQVEALTDSAEMWTPLPTVPPSDRFQPFPVDALPEPLRGFVTAGATAIGCDPSFIALPLLTVCGAAIGNTARLKLKEGWLAPPLIWTMIVGESGSAKTPAFQLVMQPVQSRQHAALKRYAAAEKENQAQMALYKKSLGQWEKQAQTSDEPPEKPNEPRAERFYIEDTTIEAVAPLLAGNPRGLLLARDELSGWLGAFDKYSSGKGGSDAAHWLSMYNAGTVTVDRKNGTPKTISVPHAAIGITGGIQPGVLNRTLGQQHRESGMAARFLLSFPPPTVRRWTDAEIDPQRVARYAEILDVLYLRPIVTDAEGQQCPGVVELSLEARALFQSFYNQNGIEQADLAGDLSAAWTKLSEYPARLALVIHCVRRAANDPTLAPQEMIDAETMSAAVRLVEWFKQEARRGYDMLAETEAERHQRRLKEWIERKAAPVTVREVHQGCRWLRPTEKAEQALQALVASGVGSWVKSLPGQSGQPTRRFHLSPVNGTYEIPDLEGDA